jgi:LacI family transcriptional regulator
MSWEREQEDVARWLRSIPKPVGVLACNDIRGIQVLDACRRINLPVPEQCAVLGVDNDPNLCEIADPPLSSIDQDEEKTGYEAAALLERMMQGEKVSNEETLVPPLGVVTRSSTDSVAVEDADLAKALRYIRLNACNRISIDDVASHIGLSRRALQRRFKVQLGRTPSDEITAMQLQRIRQMLTETDLKLQVVAERAGFHYVSHLSSFFKSHMAMTPGQYRRQARRGKPEETVEA